MENNNKKKKKNEIDSNEGISKEVVTRVLNGFAYTGGSSLASLSVQCPFTSGTLLSILEKKLQQFIVFTLYF